RDWWGRPSCLPGRQECLPHRFWPAILRATRGQRHPASAERGLGLDGLEVEQRLVATGNGGAHLFGSRLVEVAEWCRADSAVAAQLPDLFVEDVVTGRLRTVLRRNPTAHLVDRYAAGRPVPLLTQFLEGFPDRLGRGRRTRSVFRLARLELPRRVADCFEQLV